MERQKTMMENGSILKSDFAIYLGTQGLWWRHQVPYVMSSFSNINKEILKQEQNKTKYDKICMHWNTIDKQRNDVVNQNWLRFPNLTEESCW